MRKLFFASVVADAIILSTFGASIADTKDDLQDVRAEIAELQEKVSPNDASLVGTLRAARLEMLKTLELALEERARAEAAGAEIAFTQERIEPNPERASQLLSEILTLTETIAKTETEVQSLGGLTQALAISRLETEKLTLAGLRAAWLQAQYGLPLPIVMPAPSGATAPVQAEQAGTRSTSEDPVADALPDMPSWGDPNFPEIDYNQYPLPTFAQQGWSYIGYWAIEERKAALDDRDEIWAVNLSAYGSEYTIDNPTLNMGCIEGEARFIYGPDTFLLSDRSNRVAIDYRIDEQPAVSTRWSITTTNQGAGLFGNDAPDMMLDIMNANTLFLRATESDGEQHDASFNLSGTAEVVERIAALCQFSTIDLSRDDYRQIQILLNNAGYSAGTPDGIWGDGSRRALEAFQEANGLEPTGAVDRATLTALGL